MKCYGISRDQDGKYVLVLKYAKMGSLRNNLFDISLLEWRHKTNLLLSIVHDLKAIHSQGIIHRGLHSGNILKDDLYSAYIADLGLSIQYMKQGGQTYGILPFVAPEILNNRPPQYTTASDVYSFGMIMWEILHGVQVTYYYKSVQPIQIVLDGFRPNVVENAPKCYVDIMKKCWHQDPEERPSAEELCEIFKNWQDDDRILKKLNNFIPFESVQSYIDLLRKVYFDKEIPENISTSDELREFIKKLQPPIRFL